ncbi:MAG: sulfotransferase [Candidatus Atribacteria bacterium]|nr:sulfotransferase [Candidatus Atribacteria bacterium]
MTIPNFFLVGAAKAGTTSFYNYLNQHPEIYMCPIKEPHYFCKDIRCKDFGEYYKKNVHFDVKNYLNQPILEKKHISFIEDQDEYLQLFREREN